VRGTDELRAIRRADKAASRAHDAMWAMNIEQSGATGFGRDELLRLREQASDEIHKLHALLRPLLAPDGEAEA
jgi:hypothetical protein